MSTRTRCSHVNRYKEYFRVIRSTQLLYADSFKAICLPQPLLYSLPLPLTASVEKVPSSGICNFTDITIEQMASVHPPLSVSTFLHALLRFLSLSFSLTHSFTDFVLWSLLPLSVSLFHSSPPLLSSCILPYSPFPFIPRA